MSDKLTDRTVLITGGGNGIGKATAIAFASRGANVVITDIDESAGNDTLNELQKFKGTAVFVQSDATQAGDNKEVVGHIEQNYGRLDFLLNNIGLFSSELDTVVDTDISYWDKVFDLNVKSVFLVSKYAIPLMKKDTREGGKAIVNIGSGAGLVGMPRRAAYCAAKAAVVNLTRAMAVDHLKDGIRVNCISPGMVDTGMMSRMISGQDDPEGTRERYLNVSELGRFVSPDEVAEAVIYLCTPQSEFINGHNLVIDGGMTIR